MKLCAFHFYLISLTLTLPFVIAWTLAFTFHMTSMTEALLFPPGLTEASFFGISDIGIHFPHGILTSLTLGMASLTLGMAERMTKKDSQLLNE